MRVDYKIRDNWLIVEGLLPDCPKLKTPCIDKNVFDSLHESFFNFVGVKMFDGRKFVITGKKFNETKKEYLSFYYTDINNWKIVE